MAISEAVGRLMLAHSGGYCANPECLRDLFGEFASGRVSSVAEIAHVIADSPRGPRGKQPTQFPDRASYANLILLCPTCHAIVDKYAAEYPVERLKEWKAQHVDRLRSAFKGRTFTNRAELRHAVARLIAANREVFENYGPYSKAGRHPLSDAPAMWRTAAVEIVIPNNREISKLLHENSDLLTESELKILAAFDVHKDGFAYNQLSGDKNTSVPTFPRDMELILKDR